MNPPTPASEKKRLEVLWDYGVLDTPPEAEFDELTALAAHICEAPVALISLVDEQRQWFKAKVGLEVPETPRDISFCAHAILQTGLFVVPDATKDPRFADSPLVTGEPFIRFYAGAPLITPDGHAVGTLCVTDRRPRELSLDQRQALRILARVVVMQLEARRRSRETAGTHPSASGKAALDSRLLVKKSGGEEFQDVARLYAEVVEKLEVGLCVWQSEPPGGAGDFRLVATNQAAARQTGIPAGQVVGRTLAECFPRLLDTELPGSMLVTLQSGEARSLDALHYTDERVPESDFRVRLFPLADRCVGMAFENITDRRIAEQAQLEGQARKSAILDAALDAIVTVDHEGRIFEWNPAAEKMFGHRRSQVLGKELAPLLFVPAAQTLVQEGLAQFISVGETRLIGHRVELTAKRAPGGEFPVELSVVRVLKSEPPIFTGFIRDITERKRFEAALREKEATLLEAQRIGRIGSWEMRLADWKLEWSDETYRIFGRARERFQPTREAFYDAVHPDDRERVRRAAEEALLGKEPYRVEHRLLLPDRSLRVVHERAELVFDAAGTPVRWIGTVQDITERKQTEEALRASQSLYLSLVENLPQNVFRKDTAGRFTFANSRFCSLLARRLEDILGRNDFDFFPAELAEKYLRDDLKVMETGQSLETVEEHVMPDLGRRYVQVVKIPLLSAAGQTIGIQGMFWDVTERREMEQALKRSEEYFRSLIENSSDIIVIVNDQASFTFVSHTIERILQYRVDEVLGRTCFDFVHPDDRSTMAQALKQAQVSTTVPTLAQLRIRHANGTWRTLEAIGKRQLDEEGRMSIVINARDITERRQLEEQLRQSQKMESVGQLAGGVAHDFNNILMVIQGHASLLLASEALGRRETTSVQQISLAAERAANLTRQLLTFSRKSMMQPKALDLNEVVKGMSKMLQRLIGEDISLHVHCAPDLPGAFADAGMLEQVLLNLAVNSRDAMPRGGQLILNTSALQATEESAGRNPDAYPGSFVCLSVTDTGTGIASQHLPHIFEPFFTTKGVGKGTGLGLATVYGIVRQHRGWITVASELGKGTVFQVFLPASLERPRVLQETPVAQPAQAGRETILLVEDEPAVRELVKSILEKHGYRVIQAPSGPAALEAWPRHRESIALLLTDLVMPDGMSGRELGQRLQADKPSLKVIYTSGYSADALGADFQADSGITFLQKPYQPRKLAQIIRTCLDAKPGS
jgi:two-component system, cell cycle sensor histidine kinase and response regulator CckA